MQGIQNYISKSLKISLKNHYAFKSSKFENIEMFDRSLLFMKKQQCQYHTANYCYHAKAQFFINSIVKIF